MTSNADRARSFDAWAPDYDRFRPGYPDELFDEIATWLALPARPLVVDLGAGTGLATLAMARRGWRLTAVEPGRPMLDVLRARASDEGLVLATVQAHAEETGLDPASVDLATAAQAYHWFDTPRALAEIERIVRPGGGLAVFWNVRDAASSPLLADYNALLESHGIDADTRLPGKNLETARHIREAGGFEEPEFVQVAHAVETTSEAFIGLAFTKSYVRALPPDGQARLADELAALIERHAAGWPSFVVPYVVDCWIARRRGS